MEENKEKSPAKKWVSRFTRARQLSRAKHSGTLGKVQGTLKGGVNLVNEVGETFDRGGKLAETVGRTAGGVWIAWIEALTKLVFAVAVVLMAIALLVFSLGYLKSKVALNHFIENTEQRLDKIEAYPLDRLYEVDPDHFHDHVHSDPTENPEAVPSGRSTRVYEPVR